MRPLVRDEILDRDAYQKVREEFRDAIIRLKRHRRVAVGDQVTLLFENRETLRFQVQEMLWVERIDEPSRIQAELDVYNELMPADGELSATLFVEITEMARIRAELDRLIGIDEHVNLALGDGPDAETIPARFDPKQMEADRIAAVQYIRFPLQPEQCARFTDDRVPARIRIDHPNYRHQAELTGEIRRSLIADLEREPEPLIGPGSGRA